MLTLDDVAAVALDLPEAAEGERHGHRTWFVGGKAFAWERPLSKADVKRHGDVPLPPGELVAVRTADLGEKEAVLAEAPAGVFTIPHFDGFAAVLLELDVVDAGVMRDLVTDAWLATAPARLADAYLAEQG